MQTYRADEISVELPDLYPTSDTAGSALVFGSADETVSLGGAEYRPCPNFMDCGGVRIKPARGPWPKRCDDCRRVRERTQDSKRKRRERSVVSETHGDPFDVLPWVDDPEPDHRRWEQVVELNREIGLAWWHGEPFERQMELWAKQLEVMKGEAYGRQDNPGQYSGPRWCQCDPLGGTVALGAGSCFSCGHLRAPASLGGHPLADRTKPLKWPPQHAPHPPSGQPVEYESGGTPARRAKTYKRVHLRDFEPKPD